MRFILALIFAASAFGQLNVGNPFYVAGTLKRTSSSSSTLNTSIVAYWKLDESSTGVGAVTRNDSVGSSHLTDNNTTASATGLISNGADFESSNNEFLSVADNAALSVGDVEFTADCWVNIESLPASGSARYILGKHGASGNFEWGVQVNNSAGTIRFRFVTSGNGTAFTIATANTFGTPTTGTWYYIRAEHDPAANTIGISVNNGTVDTTALSGGIFDGNTAFAIGSQSGAAAASVFDGIVEECGIWKKKFTVSEAAERYNSGSGTTYPF